MLVSLDLFDPNYLTGQEVTTDLYLINDSWHDANVHVDLLLTKENPEWIPEAECFDRPVKRWSYDFTIKADSVTKTPIKWQLPKEEGNYWLTARQTGTKDRPVLSQRFVRAVHAPDTSEALQRRTFVVLGADDAAREFFRAMKLQTWVMPESGTMTPLDPEKHTVVIWNASLVTADVKRVATKLLGQCAGSGGRVIVLATRSWDWPELCDVKIDHDPRFSRVFAAPGLSTPASGGIDPQWLIRWNGLPGTVAYGKLDGDIMKHAKTILWAHDPETVVMANVPAVSGKGKILFSQLIFQDRVNESGGHYDPVAARLLIRLLEQDF